VTDHSPEHSAALGIRAPFGPHLVAKGRLRPGQWEEAKTRGRGDFAETCRALVGLGYLAEDELLSELAAYTGLPLAPAQSLEQPAEAVPGLSYQFLKTNRLAPLGQSDGRLDVAVVDPFAAGALEALAQLTGLSVEPWLAPEERVLRKVESDYGLGSRGLDALGAGGDELEAGGLESLDDLSSEAPIIRLLNFLVDRAVRLGASDIHVEPQESALRVRYRIDGVLHDQQRLDKGYHAPLTSRIKIMAQLNIAERRLPQDGRINLRVGGRSLDLRVSTLPTSFGESVVLRILYRDSLLWELAGVGVGPHQLARLEELIRRPYGLMLVTGPTGSGKTTTLYCALKQINSPDAKIITIEDPVEYRLEGVNQIQVNTSIGLTFAGGLRSILRQDPDIILVGEIRDAETAGIAIHSALTGHLVFSTLHTNDAAGAITRLQDMGVDSYLISSSLTAVAAQRLVRRLCPDCRRPAEVDAEVLARHGITAEPGRHRVYGPAGCEACAQRGYTGRTGIFELLEVCDQVRELINRQADTDSLRQAALSQGMRALRQDGWLKVADGTTSLEEVLRVTSV
jgi:type II secretion system protein E